MMRKYFKAVADADGSDWFIALFGTDSEDNKDYSLTTNSVHASQLSMISAGAKGDCELVADLLNWYHNDKKAVETINKFKKGK